MSVKKIPPLVRQTPGAEGDDNHMRLITDYKVYHPGRDLSNGGFCNG